MDRIPTTMEDCAGQPLKPNMIKLYKFRSLEHFGRIADIMENQRFYMAPFSELNDPMEGLFHSPTFSEDFRKDLENAQKALRICSFNRRCTSSVCWAHYADEFKGICIEIEIDSNAPVWCPVNYEPSRTVIDENNYRTHQQIPHFLLTWKLEAWSYEQEMRFIERDEYLYADPWWTMKRVLLGVRTPDAVRRAIRRITPTSVSVWTTKISDHDCIEIDEIT